MSTSDELTAEKALAMTYTDYVACEKIVSAPLPVAFEKFHDYVWLKGGGLGPESWTTLVAPGEDKSLVGETRSAAGIMHEKILRTIPNHEIMYSVVAGPFPVNNHLGIVTFTPEGENATKIVWGVKFTPKLGMGLPVKGLIKSVFTLFLYNFEKHLTAKSSEPAMASPTEVADAESQTFTSSTSVERIVSAPVPVAFQKFREVVWLRNAGVGPASWTHIVQDGEGDLHVGEIRKAGGVTEEKILRVVPNELIVYSVIKGPIPVHNHMGSVIFTPEGNDKTKITWTVKYTPVMGMDLAFKGLIQSFFPVFLNRLDAELTKSS